MRTIYLDNAATSYPKPQAVKNAVFQAIEEEGGNAGRSAHRLAMRAEERVFSARETLKNFFGLKDERGVIFTKNATEAINLSVAVFAKEGSHVLCDDLSHNALLRPLYALEDAGKISLSLFSSQKGASDLEKKWRPDTSLIALTHASNIFSYISDAEAIGNFCEKHGVAFLLDASQSAGHCPIDIERIKADVICLPGHKGLLGIMGAGVALFRRWKGDYPPFLSGGAASYSKWRQMPKELPEHFEAGTLPLPAIAAMEAGVLWIKEQGLASIRAHIGALEKELLTGLATVPGILLYGKEHTGNGVISFSHPNFSCETLAAMLDEHGIAVRAGLHCAPTAHQTLGTEKKGTVRISLGAFNTEKECEIFLDRLERITHNE